MNPCGRDVHHRNARSAQPCMGPRFWSLRFAPFHLGCQSYSGVLRDVVAARHAFSHFHRAAFFVRSSVLGMLSSSISASKRAYYHFPTRPEWRERTPGLSLRNLGVGAESARCVLVEFSAHFGASKSTFGAPLALPESENMRFVKV